MGNPAKPVGLLLIIGVFMTFASAANFTCPPPTLNETTLCPNVSILANEMDPCMPTFQEYACADALVLANLSDNILVNLSSCYTNNTILSLDPVYATLFFSKLDSGKTSAVFDQLNNQFLNLSLEWRKFLLFGIWPQLTTNLSNSQGIPANVQPLLVHIIPDMVMCLRQQNVTCGGFQELVRNLDMTFPRMTAAAGKQLYPPLKSFLGYQKNVTGLACSENINSSVWIKQNLGTFSQFADLGDFTALFVNFSALDALSFLTIPQIANFSVDFNPQNNSAAIGNIMATLPDANAVLQFLSSLNAAATLKNLSMVQPSLSQALLNKTFELVLANASTWNSSDWSQLFNNKIRMFLPEITPDQLKVIPLSISCDSYQAIVGSLDSKFQQMTPGNQGGVFKTLIQPYLKTQGPACSLKGNSSALLRQNFGQFSKFADYSDLLLLGGNFSALDALPSLTIPQIASLTVDINSTTNPAAIGNILATLPNANALTEFLSSMNVAAGLKNKSSLPSSLAQALLNKTFDVLKANFSNYNSAGWTQLMQNQLSIILPEITGDQMSLIPQNLTCDSFQAIVKGLDMKFQQMSPTKTESLYKGFIKPFLNKQGPTCSQNLNSSALLSQNFGQFSKFADYSDVLALNANFSAMTVLSSLTLNQKVGFSLVANATDAATIVGSLQNASDFQDFLNQFNAAALMKNLSTVQAPLSQALLNKTFELLLANASSWNASDWNQLFQKKIAMFLPEVTAQQLTLIPQNISCDSYKTIVGSLDLNFQKMTPANQQAIFQTLIQPYVKKQGPSCSQAGNSNALLKQNFGQFSKYANFADLLGLGGNFNAVDVLPSLTTAQLVDFTLNTTINPMIASSIAANLKAPADVYTFLSTFKIKNQAEVNPELAKVLLSQTFHVLQPSFNTFSSQNWSLLFQDHISAFLPEITSDQLKLIPKNISCDSYQLLVRTLDSSSSQMATANQQSVYKDFIKPYLARKDKLSNVVICYNQSDINSSAWLVTNMASFMAYTSEEDLTVCANTATLQTFASDASAMKLASQLKLTSDAGLYYTSLLTSNKNISIMGLPDAFLCFLNSAALQSLNGNDALTLTPKINKQCFNGTSGQATTTPSTKDLQLATSLVGKLTNFSADNLVNLGQTAVGLSMGQINKISDKDLQSSVSSLASVSGWNNGQTRSIMTKLLNANFTITNLTNLGSLVTGLPSKKLSTFSQAAVLSAAKDPQFVSKISSAPVNLQSQFVQQIIGGDTNTSSLVNNVPANLVSFIPPSKLFSKTNKLSLSDVNDKPWTSSQAAMFFDDLLLTTANYTDISASVLQGFTCVTPNKISNNQLRNLAKAMKTQNATPKEDQLTCLSRQVVKNGYPSDLNQYPEEIFLYLNATTYSISANATCKDFFTIVGAANVSILQKGTSLRSSLLSQALSCLNVTGFALTSAHAQVLGQLVCDLNSTYIESSYSDLVCAMSPCKSFTSDQQTAILKVLSKGTSSFGSPSSWTTDTLNSLGAISGFLDKGLLGNISSISLKSWLTAAIPSKLLTRSQFSTIIQTLTSSRAKRAAGCTVGNITADNVNSDLIPLDYSASQLEACLDNDTLVNYLDVLSSKAFTTEQLTVLKNKLDALYPGGYPEPILPSLGAITFQCTDSDINKWNITTVDTLQGLLAAGPPSSVAKSIIGKYISSDNPLTSNAINVIGSNICVLTSAQVDSINSTALGEATPLDISSCSQTLKDSLYSKAKAYSQGVTSDTSAYYNLIKPYLGGAPLADLKALASSSPNMDVVTFTTLNPSIIGGLTVSDVKSLLGNNTADLTSQVSNPVVNQWISSQKQSDLDTLGLGIQGGIRDTVTSAPTTTKGNSAPPGCTQGLAFILAIAAAICLL